MLGFYRGYEVEIDGIQYYVSKYMDVYVKDDDCIRVPAAIKKEALLKAYELNDKLEQEVKKAEKVLNCKTYYAIDYDAFHNKWELRIYSDKGWPVLFEYKTIEDMISTVKAARKLYKGVKTERLIESLVNVKRHNQENQG